MRPVTAALAALALSAPAATRAQPVSTPAGAGPDTYLELHLGAYLPQASDLDALDAGWDIGGTFGARFSPNASVEAELSYVHATGTPEGAPSTDERQLQLLPFTASLRLRVPFKVAELSAFGGAGVYFAWFESTDTLIGLGPSVTTHSSQDDTTFGFHAGAALAFNLSPTMTVGAEVRRTFVTAKLGGADVALDGVRVAATLGYHF